jgi:hypothetical protein
VENVMSTAMAIGVVASSIASALFTAFSVWYQLRATRDLVVEVKEHRESLHDHDKRLCVLEKLEELHG